MTVPTKQDWLFAVKLYAATLLALYIALWADLPRPYWAISTVFITGQLFVGATNAKARYRIYGTVLGSAAGVALLPNLVNAPELLTAAIATWVAVCLYLSLLDRTPRSYILMLSGYTAAFVGFPTVGTPDMIFDVAVARTEEIALGVLCASLVMSQVFPRHACPMITSRLDKWFKDAAAWSGSLFGRFGSNDDRASRLRLACGVIAFDGLVTSVRHELVGAGRSAEALSTLRQHMLMLIPTVVAIGDRARALETRNALPKDIRKALDVLAAKSVSATAISAEAREIRPLSEAQPRTLSRTWNDLLIGSLLVRLKDFIDLGSDAEILRQHVRDGQPITEHLAFRYSGLARTVRHRDHTMAALSAISAFLAIAAAGAAWIATGWPDGAAAPMMAAVGCSFFAIQDNPVPQIMDLAKAAVVGAFGAGLYLFAILPLATNFEMLALVLAPALISCGLLMMQPPLALLGMGTVVIGSTLLALQNSYVGDFGTFANMAIAVVFGLWTAALVTRLVRSVGAARSARRLRRLNRSTLVEAAAGDIAADGTELTVLMLDRLGLLAPRISALPATDAEWTKELLNEVLAGHAVVALHGAKDDLQPAAKEPLERLMSGLVSYFESNEPHAPKALLGEIDSTLDALSDADDPSTSHDAMLALTDLRLGLFLEAAPYRSKDPTFSKPEVAA